MAAAPGRIDFFGHLPPVGDDSKIALAVQFQSDLFQRRQIAAMAVQKQKPPRAMSPHTVDDLLQDAPQRFRAETDGAGKSPQIVA